MALEPVQFLDDLVVTNPTDTDPVSEGDNHIRNLKIALAAALTGNSTAVRMIVGGDVRFLALPDGVEITLDSDNIFLRFLNSVDDVGIAFRITPTGLLTIFETDGAGVLGNAFASFTRGAGVGLRFVDVQKIVTTDKGVNVAGQVIVSDPAPLNPDELARKDYVDDEISTLDTSLLAAIAVVQADLDNVKDGFAFTGDISAPTVTET